jgi:hypothetical protein
MQRGLFRICKISPRDFWSFTPAETFLMFEEGRLARAELFVTIRNAQFTKKDGKPFEISDYVDVKEREPTIEEIEQAWWNSAD